MVRVAGVRNTAKAELGTHGNRTTTFWQWVWRHHRRCQGAAVVVCCGFRVRDKMRGDLQHRDGRDRHAVKRGKHLLSAHHALSCVEVGGHGSKTEASCLTPFGWG